MGAELGIVIITYNSAEHIGALLDSLPAGLAGVDADVVVVDNGSVDETRALVRARGECELIESTNVGYAAGFNLGVRHLPDARSLLILNPDLELGPGCVPPMLVALDEVGIGMVAPQIRDPHGEIYPSIRREPSPLRSLGLSRLDWPTFSEFVSDPAAYRTDHVVDWTTGAVLLVDRRCYDALGGWDESYFLYSEETDFCLRARDRGWATLYLADAWVTHVGGGSGQSDLTQSMVVVNRVRLYHRRHPGVRAWVFLGLTALREAVGVLTGKPHAKAMLTSLLRPSRRPPQIHASESLLPR